MNIRVDFVIMTSKTVGTSFNNSGRSMIAKLPGSNQNVLANNLEVALLFQSAEIERLNKSLAQQKQIDKVKSKNNLDRHSYEVQIKELSFEVMQAKEYLVKKGMQAEQITNKYERALIEIDKMYKYN